MLCSGIFCCCCGLCSRPIQWILNLSLSVPSVSNYNFDKSKQCIGAMTIEIDFLQKKSTDSSPYDSDRMAAEFIQQFNNQSFSVTQQVHFPQNIYTQTQTRLRTLSCFSGGFLIILLFFSLSQLVFSFCDKLFGLMVKDIEAMDASILKGEPASGKKQKVPDCMLRLMCALRFILKSSKTPRSQYHHLQAFVKWGYYRVVGLWFLKLH